MLHGFLALVSTLFKHYFKVLTMIFDFFETENVHKMKNKGLSKTKYCINQFFLNSVAVWIQKM
jgi:hypothetical protein